MTTLLLLQRPTSDDTTAAPSDDAAVLTPSLAAVRCIAAASLHRSLARMASAFEGTPSSRFFVIKTRDYKSLTLSRTAALWRTPLRPGAPAQTQPHERIAAAYLSASVDHVFLLASVNGSRAFQGFARVMSPASAEFEQHGLAGFDASGSARYSSPFRVAWCVLLDAHRGLPHDLTRHILNAIDGRPVPEAHGCSELSPDAGIAVCRMLLEAAAAAATTAPSRPCFYAAGSAELAAADEPADIGAQWSGLLARAALEGAVLCASNLGSRAYNLHHALSDVDMLVLVAAPPHKLLPLDGPLTTIRNHESFKPDFTLHEAGSFVHHLLAGDPKMLEALFAGDAAPQLFTFDDANASAAAAATTIAGDGDGDGDGDDAIEEHDRSQVVVFSSDAWRALVRHRARFCSKESVRRYVREIHGAKGVRKVDSFRTKLLQLCAAMRAALEQYRDDDEDANDDGRRRKRREFVALMNEMRDIRVHVGKRWYILFRLCLQAQQLLDHGSLCTWFPSRSIERRFVTELRQFDAMSKIDDAHVHELARPDFERLCRSELDRSTEYAASHFDAMLARLEHTVSDLESRLPSSSLPEMPSAEPALEWLRTLRSEQCADTIASFAAKREQELHAAYAAATALTAPRLALVQSMFESVLCHGERLLWLAQPSANNDTADGTAPLVGVYCQSAEELLRYNAPERPKLERANEVRSLASDGRECIAHTG